ncbi:MAG: DNA repair exonuclease, partial [Chloroflexota bacterium]
LTAWRRIVTLAIDEEVDFVLIAGDAFESANRTLPGQLNLRNGLKRLADAGIDSYVVSGNHDHEGGYIPSVTWPDRAHAFSTTKVESKPVVRNGVEIARVYGMGYKKAAVTDNLVLKFKREPGVPFAIGLLHTNVGGDTSAGNYAPCTITDLRNAGMDYWALGHIHRHAILNAASPTVIYCGNPQGRDPGEVEPRGCYLVTVAADGTVTPEFRVTDEVRWRLLDVPIGDVTTEEGLVNTVVREVDAARTEAGRSIVARVTLTGAGPAHRLLAKTGLLNGVLTTAREDLGEAAPFAWIESLRDATRPEFDREARKQADDFLGSVLRLIDTSRASLAVAPGTDGPAALDDTDELGAHEIDELLDELYANARARPFLRDHRPSPSELLALLERAESMVVDQLTEQG